MELLTDRLLSCAEQIRLNSIRGLLEICLDIQTNVGVFLLQKKQGLYDTIASNKNCSQCGVEIIELAEHGPRQASPQRMDPSNLSYSGENCVVFCLFCQFFNLDTPDTEVQPLLVEIAANSNPNNCLSSDWTPPMAIPYPSPLHENAPIDPEYLKWLDEHLGTYTAVGLWYRNEAAKKTTQREISVTRQAMIDLWRKNGG